VARFARGYLRAANNDPLTGVLLSRCGVFQVSASPRFGRVGCRSIDAPPGPWLRGCRCAARTPHGRFARRSHKLASERAASLLARWSTGLRMRGQRRACQFARGLGYNWDAGSITRQATSPSLAPFTRLRGGPCLYKPLTRGRRTDRFSGRFDTAAGKRLPQLGLAFHQMLSGLTSATSTSGGSWRSWHCLGLVAVAARHDSEATVR